jgi:hypothetical protein
LQLTSGSHSAAILLTANNPGCVLLSGDAERIFLRLKIRNRSFGELKRERNLKSLFLT